MIKGHSYDRQLYYSVAHRIINNTFLNKSSGIFENVGNGCAMTQTTNTITISDGFFIVQGGITEVEGSEIITIPLNNSYCRLVYEVDMSQTNTETEFNQGKFKLLSGTNAYPALTQQELTASSGIYQYEFAQFIASTGGISNFVDKRTFLNYDSIYAYIQEQIESIEDQSIFLLKIGGTISGDLTVEGTLNAIAQKASALETARLINLETGATGSASFDGSNDITIPITDLNADKLSTGIIPVARMPIAVLTGNFAVAAASTAGTYNTSQTNINYPSGFSKSNCIPIAIGKKYQSSSGYTYESIYQSSLSLIDGSQPIRVLLDNSNIQIAAQNYATSAKTLYYQIVLMKIA